MSSSIPGVVRDGVVVPGSPLPEGASVEILISSALASPMDQSPAQLRKMPRARRQAILEAAAVLAEEDYRSDTELTGFEAFSEEANDDSDSDSA